MNWTSRPSGCAVSDTPTRCQPRILNRRFPGRFCAKWVLLLLFALPPALQAQFSYVTNNGTIIITRYTGPGGAVSIPSTTNGLAVTMIGANAFENCAGLTNVSIPGSVTTIGASAFDSCTSLTGLAISNGVITIDSTAFYNCSSLASVTLPDSVMSIGQQAFSDCYGLTNVTIPDSVTFIDGGAFAYCFNLTSLSIPSSVAVIGNSAFAGCSSLTAITVDEQNPSYSSADGVLFNQDRTTLIQCPAAKAGSYTVPDTVTCISGTAFYQCGLTSVAIPDSVTAIGGLAFWNCNSLTNVSIPDSVTSIGLQAFYECASLATITVDALNPFYSSVDGVLFDKDQTMLIQCPEARAGSYTVADTVTNIGSFAFDSCASLTSVTIGSSVTSIGDWAFCACPSLTGVYFNTNAPNLGAFVFWTSDNATIYYLPETSVWGPTFGDVPTAPWRPQVQTGDGSFGVSTKGFGFNTTWASGRVVVVEACADLANPIWSPVATNTLAAGSACFSDPQWADYPARFYRLRWLW